MSFLVYIEYLATLTYPTGNITNNVLIESTLPPSLRTSDVIVPCLLVLAPLCAAEEPDMMLLASSGSTLSSGIVDREDDRRNSLGGPSQTRLSGYMTAICRADYSSFIPASVGFVIMPRLDESCREGDL